MHVRTAILSPTHDEYLDEASATRPSPVAKAVRSDHAKAKDASKLGVSGTVRKHGLHCPCAPSVRATARQRTVKSLGMLRVFRVVVRQTAAQCATRAGYGCQRPALREPLGEPSSTRSMVRRCTSKALANTAFGSPSVKRCRISTSCASVSLRLLLALAVDAAAALSRVGPPCWSGSRKAWRGPWRRSSARRPTPISALPRAVHPFLVAHPR